MIKIVGIGSEGSTITFEVEFDFRGEVHRMTIKKTMSEILQFGSKKKFLEYVKKTVMQKRLAMFADYADELVPLNEDIEQMEVTE